MNNPGNHTVARSSSDLDLPRAPRHRTPARMHDIGDFVEASRAAADPYHRRHDRTSAPTGEENHPLDARKTARDLGRIDVPMPIDLEPHLTGPVGGDGPEPTLCASHKAQAL